MKNGLTTMVCIIILMTFLSIFLLLYNSKFETDDTKELDVSFMEHIDDKYRINSSINEYINVMK